MEVLNFNDIQSGEKLLNTRYLAERQCQDSCAPSGTMEWTEGAKCWLNIGTPTAIQC